jgi:Putative peptidoglycan binding domain
VALSWPVVTQGNTGENVRTIQFLLSSHGHSVAVDGDYGPSTKAAVQAFQSSKGLTADGVVGPQTWPQLIVQVSNGSQGDAVKALQDQIHSRGAAPIAVDGAFGSETQSAVEAFQTILGFSVDGTVGTVTWNAIVDGYLLGPGPSQAGFAVYLSWTANDEADAKKNASSDAVTQLFTQKWAANDHWTFDNGQGAAGTIYYAWKQSSGQTLTFAVSDGAESFFFVRAAYFQ